MANMIWQIGNSRDDQVCAESLQKKNNARLVTTENVDSFSSLTMKDRLQIVSVFSLLTGTASGMTPSQIAELLIVFDLETVNHISLVICNSAEPCQALGGKSFMETLRECLINQAVIERRSLYIGTITGRKGYVNVYNEVMQASEIDHIVRGHFTGSSRTPEVGRKYVQTEPTVNSPDNIFINKGFNKATTEGVAVEDGINLAVA